PGREVIQPTVVDPASFKVWRGEAFELWLSQWASVYSEPGDETSRRVIEVRWRCRRRRALSGVLACACACRQPVLISAARAAACAACVARTVRGLPPLQGIVESYFLVNLVDNDYTSEGSDIFALFKRVIAEQLSRGALLARVEELEGTNAALRRQTDALSTRLVRSPPALLLLLLLLLLPRALPPRVRLRALPSASLPSASLLPPARSVIAMLPRQLHMCLLVPASHRPAAPPPAVHHGGAAQDAGSQSRAPGGDQPPARARA
ncbi:MAG: SAM-binding domain-containing protein, partial [Allorhizobium sp.]